MDLATHLKSFLTPGQIETLTLALENIEVRASMRATPPKSSETEKVPTPASDSVKGEREYKCPCAQDDKVREICSCCPRPLPTPSPAAVEAATPEIFDPAIYIVSEKLDATVGELSRKLTELQNISNGAHMRIRDLEAKLKALEARQ